MYTAEMKKQFVELRAQGSTFDAISEKLGVSRQTLISWSKEHHIEIENLRELELEAHRDKYFANQKKRIEVIGKKFAQLLERADSQLEDPHELIPTERTLHLLLKYGKFLRDEERPVILKSKKESTDSDGSTVEQWNS